MLVLPDPVGPVNSSRPLVRFSTRSSGCGAVCPKAAVPCVGCYGATEDSPDQGARLLNAVASVIDSRDPAEIEKILDGIPDPAGMFYRFGMPGSLLRASKTAWKNGD